MIDPVIWSRSAVVIAGAIGAGKCSITGYLKSQFGWDVVSFGQYVQATAEDRGLDTSRDVLQRVGRELMEAYEPHEFLLDVVR